MDREVFEEKPREKLLERGVSSLSNSEILGILLNSGIRNQTATEVAKKVLLMANGRLSDLARLGIPELTKIDGIGLSKAILIISAFEIGRRKTIESVPKSDPITKSRQVYELFSDLIDQTHESFWILLLKRSNMVLSRNKISDGGVSGTVVDVKIILKQAIEKLASSIVLIHNHPSGNTNPSNQDVQLTLKIKEATKYMDIYLFDHIIIGQNSYFSFADEGMIQ